MAAERSPEPKCCCCGVTVGLGVLYVLLLIGGIIEFASIGNVKDALSIAVAVLQGILLIVASFIGAGSIMKPTVKHASHAMYFYAAMEGIFIILSIIPLATVNATVDAQLATYKDKNPTVSDTDLQSIKTTAVTAVISATVIGIVISLVIVGLIIQRMYLYKKWLAESETSDIVLENKTW